MEKMIGKITHYFPKIGVAVVKLEDNLNNGDEIRISGMHSDFRQMVVSMQIEHKTIVNAAKGQDIGIKVTQNVHEGDMIFKIE